MEEPGRSLAKVPSSMRPLRAMPGSTGWPLTTWRYQQHPGPFKWDEYDRFEERKEGRRRRRGERRGEVRKGRFFAFSRQVHQVPGQTSGNNKIERTRIDGIAKFGKIGSAWRVEREGKRREERYGDKREGRRGEALRRKEIKIRI